MPTLFDPIDLGGVRLPNRILMAPCTRNRAAAGDMPTPMMADYYAQRASAGLIISEGINPEPRGNGYYGVPGAYTDAQQAAWRGVADAVGAAGGHIFGQIMHCGRISFPELQPGGARPIGASAIAPDPDFRGMTYGCPKPDRAYEPPRALETAEIAALVDSFADAARRLIAAGMDGVELHGGSGYLPMQFLSSNTNRRDDAYGGDIAGRSRFLLDVVDAMIGAVGAGRVAVKLSPAFRFHDVHDADPAALYAHVAARLSDRGLAYVQVSDYGDYYSFPGLDPIGLVRRHYRGTLVANGGLNAHSAQRLLDAGGADAVAFGAAFIANPDLPRRFAGNAPLNVPDPTTFYEGGARGYVDYPTLDEDSVGPVTLHYAGSRSADFEASKRGATATAE